MKLIVANSKNWFKLRSDIKKKHDIFFIKDVNNLTYDSLKKFNPDYVFFPHWNSIVPDLIHENYKCIVFHTAPLPYGRGGSPIQNLILNDFENSPVCALKMTNQIDSGPIYAKKNISLAGTLKEIFIRINLVINDLIVDILTKDIQPIEQTKEGFSFKRLTLEDNMLPENANLKNIFDRVRMLDHPSYPSPYIKYGSLKFEFSKAKLINSELKLSCKVTKC